MSARSRILGPPVPKMPSGLVELMDGLARDVLKNNPENIYEFCAHHMETLLEIRDGRAFKPLITLEEKIKKAQKTVQQRAEERRREYDKKIAEVVIKQQVLPPTDVPCCDDSEYLEKEGIGKVFTDDREDEKEKINLGEEQVLEKPVVVSTELRNETNDENNVLNSNDHEDVKLDKINENNSKQEVLIVIDSDETKQNEDECDKIIKDEGINDRIENNISNEIEPAVIVCDIDKQDNVIVESVPDSAAIKFESNTEEKNSKIESTDFNLHEECVENIKNDGGTESLKETRVEDLGDKAQSADTAEIIILPSDVNSQDADCIDKKHCEKPIDVPLETKQTNNADCEAVLNVETNDVLNKCQAIDLSETEKLRDNVILTVLLNSNNAESVPIQNIEPDTVPPNELDAVKNIVSELISNDSDQPDQTSEKIIDTENILESKDDNDKISNINSSMDLETAAITIQKVFRSFLFKTKTASYDDPTTVDINLLAENKGKEEDEQMNIKERRPLGINRMDTVLQTVNEEKSLSLSTDDSSTLSSAATIIQAHVRGFLVRNKLNLNKTVSSNSLIDSDAPSIPSLEADSDHIKSKTVLNIHIVPEGGHFVSRDESILTSMDLSLDSSPPSSVNLHPLGYDKSERRKQLKREDAIQSVSPPSNNSGKLSEEHDSVKEVLTIESNAGLEEVILSEEHPVKTQDILEKTEVKLDAANDSNIGNQISDAASDEMDVITPFSEDRSSRESDNSTKLLHSGEFHDIVVPTNVTRSDTSVVRGE